MNGHIAGQPNGASAPPTTGREYKMNKSEIKNLQDIVMGKSWDVSVITKAIKFADTFEIKHLLIALRAGRCSFESRMALQSFICRLSVK